MNNNSKVTADTITEVQIRDLGAHGVIDSALMREALDHGALAFIADIRHARRVCAAMWNSDARWGEILRSRC